MKTVSIDRFEGTLAICEDKDGRFFGIETSELPQGAKEGTILKIDDAEGTLSIDEEETARRRKKKCAVAKRCFWRLIKKSKKLYIFSILFPYSSQKSNGGTYR